MQTAEDITATLITSTGHRHKLTLDTDLRLAGALFIVGADRAFDRAQLRADPGAKIITSNPQAVCWALGILYPDPQVVEE